MNIGHHLLVNVGNYKMILIGSRALKLRASSYFKRTPVDFDWIATQEEVDDWLSKNLCKFKEYKTYRLEGKHDKYIVEGDSICEFELVKDNTSTQMLVDLVQSDKDTIETSFGLIPSLDMLFTIKSSHKYLKNSPFFWKNLGDYHLMKQMGAKVRPEYQEFLKVREKETYNYSHPKLNQSKKDFFSDDGLTYLVEHDDIHESVKIYDRPAYTYYLKDGAEVNCDKSKFFSVSQEIRLAGVAEEAMTLAIERSLLPFPGVMTPKQAWMFALMKVCSSITSGYFREFAYEHLPEVIKIYPENYFVKFQKDLSEGKIRYVK
jgi:hypothetical protein